jgi:hypothetical protein
VTAFALLGLKQPGRSGGSSLPRHSRCHFCRFPEHREAQPHPITLSVICASPAPRLGFFFPQGYQFRILHLLNGPIKPEGSMSLNVSIVSPTRADFSLLVQADLTWTVAQLKQAICNAHQQHPVSAFAWSRSRVIQSAVPSRFVFRS